MEAPMRLTLRATPRIPVKVAVILSVSPQQDATVMLLGLEHVFSIPHSWLRTLTPTLLAPTHSMTLLAQAVDWLDMMLEAPTHLIHHLMLNI